MKKHVLVLYYTQSGQLRDVVKSFASGFDNSPCELDIVEVKPEADFSFPWTSESFFDAMPETVLRKPVELAPLKLKRSVYDLVVLAYQPWFLSLRLSLLTRRS